MKIRIKQTNVASNKCCFYNVINHKRISKVSSKEGKEEHFFNSVTKILNKNAQ